MTDAALYRTFGQEAINVLEEEANKDMSSWTTEQIAEFWHGAAEACTLRLVRLKPELVRRWPPE